MNRGARVHFARGIRHLCYSDLLPAIFIVFQKPIKIDPPAEVSRVARFFKPAQKGRRLEVREWDEVCPLFRPFEPAINFSPAGQRCPTLARGLFRYVM